MAIPKSHKKVQVFIYWFLLFSQVGLFILSELLSGEPKKIDFLFYIFFAISVVFSMVSFLVHKLRKNENVMKQWTSFYSISLSQIPEKRRLTLGLNESNLKYWLASNQILGAVTFSWGVGAAIGVNGFVMAFLYGASFYSRGLIFFSIILILLLRPDWDQLNSFIKKLCKDR